LTFCTNRGKLKYFQTEFYPFLWAELAGGGRGTPVIFYAEGHRWIHRKRIQSEALII
jgi:hypothetical protein